MSQATFRTIRRAGVPVCCIETADPAATIKACVSQLNGKADQTPLVAWDIIRGIVGLNDAGKLFAQDVAPNGPIESGNPAEALKLLADRAPDETVCFFQNAQRFIGNESVAQGIWNLRDVWKSKHCTLCLLAPNLTLPAELKQDVVIISEDLPGELELSAIVGQICKDAEIDAKGIKESLPVIVDTLRGLSAFAAEQVLALSASKAGFDLDGLWDRKRRMIEQTPGLAVWRGGESFDDLGGLDNLKSFLTRVLTSGKTPVRAIGFIDEIEKGIAGSQSDSSGTSQDQLQVFLKVMQDYNIPGLILVGHGGTGKSAIAKAAGTIAGAPVISIDTGAMKGSLVGESEGRIRAAMDVFKAVSVGAGLFIATCNKITSLPPELRRRFTLGTFFVDLPSAEERKAIWRIWQKRYNRDSKDTLPPCDGWTGAEIRACCDVADRTGLTLIEASKYVVPVVKSAPDQVEALRKLANGRFISASAPGVYNYNQGTATAGRKMGSE